MQFMMGEACYAGNLHFRLPTSTAALFSNTENLSHSWFSTNQELVSLQSCIHKGALHKPDQLALQSAA